MESHIGRNSPFKEGLDDDLPLDKKVFKEDKYLFQRYIDETKDIPRKIFSSLINSSLICSRE